MNDQAVQIIVVATGSFIIGFIGAYYVRLWLSPEPEKELGLKELITTNIPEVPEIDTSAIVEAVAANTTTGSYFDIFVNITHYVLPILVYCTQSTVILGGGIFILIVGGNGGLDTSKMPALKGFDLNKVPYFPIKPVKKYDVSTQTDAPSNKVDASVQTDDKQKMGVMANFLWNEDHTKYLTDRQKSIIKGSAGERYLQGTGSEARKLVKYKNGKKVGYDPTNSFPFYCESVSSSTSSSDIREKVE